MKRPGKHAQLKLLGLFALLALACPVRAEEAVRLEAPAAEVTRSGVIAGAALAISQLAIWRNNMPRVIQPGQADTGSPLVVKAEVEAKDVKAPVKLGWKVELVPAGGAAQAVPALEVNVESKPWSGELKPGEPTYIEFYSKAPGTLAPGSKAKLVITFTAGGETVKLEGETTVEKVD